MDKETINSLKANEPYDKLALDLRVAIEEDWDLVEDLKVSDEIKKIAYQIILSETVKRKYKELNKELKK